MARLPDLNDFGARPSPRSNRSIATVRNAGAVAEAVGNAGDDLTRYASQQFEREDKLNYASAKTVILKADALARQELDNDPDFSTYESRYQEKMAKAREQAASLIKSKSDRRLFDVDTAMDLERGTLEVRRVADNKRKANDLAVGANSLEDLLAVSRTAEDDATRQAAIGTADETINGMVQRGVLDPGKAMETRRDWHNRYIGQQILGKIDKGDIEGANGLMGRFGTYLSSDDYLRLSSALSGERKAQTVIGAADVGMGTGLVKAPDDVPNLVKSLFPNVRITDSGKRTGPLAVANPKSYHIGGHAIDVAPIPGMTFDEYVGKLKSAGVPVVEAIDEVKHPSKHATGPHWHVAWAASKPVGPKTIDEAISTAVAALGPNASADLIDATRQEVSKRWTTKKASEQQAEDDAVENAQAALMKNGGNWYALPASIRNTVDPKYVPGLIDFGTGLQPNAPKRATDANTYVQLSDMAATNPKAFAALNPVQYRNALDDDDWNRMVAHRAEILGKADAPAERGTLGMIRTVISPLRQASGLTTNGLDAKKPADKKKIAEVNGRIYNLEKSLMSDVANWQHNNPGKKPSGEDIQKMADRRLMSVYQDDKSIFQFEFKAGPGKANIPDADQARIVREMTPILGRRPTGTEIYAAYVGEARQ